MFIIVVIVYHYYMFSHSFIIMIINHYCYHSLCLFISPNSKQPQETMIQ